MRNGRAVVYEESKKQSILLADKFEDVPAKGMVTMLDLGAHACIPCNMMEPIIKKLEKTYDGKAALLRCAVGKE
jgi:thiol-disulfide isomerase/thioredoxin